MVHKFEVKMSPEEMEDLRDCYSGYRLSGFVFTDGTELRFSKPLKFSISKDESKNESQKERKPLP